MEGRSDSIKDPIYYPSMQDAANGCGASEVAASASASSLAAPASEVEIAERSRSSAGSQELSVEERNALKVPRKFIVNWRQACDRTRDRTKDLLKRWRTVATNVDEIVGTPVVDKPLEHPGWSVHVWTTWVSRYASDENLAALESDNGGNLKDLAAIQHDKFSHFFTYLLDHDKDGFIDRKDFRIFTERLRRFADWSWNGPEYLRLLEAEQGLAELILQEAKYEGDRGKRISLEDWLRWWAGIVAPAGGATYNDVPFWLKILPQIFFLAINSSANGIISKKELGSFYGSVVGLDPGRISKSLDVAYDSMTSVNVTILRGDSLASKYEGIPTLKRFTENGDHPLGWRQYQLVYANFLFGRGPFGPGEHFLGLTDSCMIRGNNVPFPIDYSAMNTPKDKLEVYSPHCRSARRSVIV